MNIKIIHLGAECVIAQITRETKEVIVVKKPMSIVMDFMNKAIRFIPPPWSVVASSISDEFELNNKAIVGIFEPEDTAQREYMSAVSGLDVVTNVADSPVAGPKGSGLIRG